MAKDKGEFELICERKVLRLKEFASELEKVNKELIGKCESLSAKLKENEKQLRSQSDEVRAARMQETRQNEELISYRENMPSIVLRLHDLIE